MKNLFVIDATLYFDETVAGLCSQPLAGGRDTLAFLVPRLGKMTLIDKIIINCLPADLPMFQEKLSGQDRKSVALETSACPADLQALLVRIRELGLKHQADNVTLFYADSPFLDPVISGQIVKTHLDNAAEYTFPDNFPDGLGVEVMSKEFLDGIVQSPAKKPELLSRRVFDNLKSDINQFYVEVWLPDEDISLKRLEFHANTKRNLRLMEKILRRVPEPDFNSIVKALNDDPGILHIFPRYVECEVTTANNERSPLIPAEAFKRSGLAMDPSLFSRIVDELAAATDDVILSFSGYGEPLYHPHFAGLLQKAAGQGGVFSVLIETNGLSFLSGLARAVTDLPPSKCQVIFKLDAARPATYAALTGSDLTKVHANIDHFLSLDPQNKLRTFVQFTKLPENIEELEEFYRFWDAKGVQVIIMKYNDFAGQLPDRKVSDLTPLDRMPCWHLQRDLVVYADGKVPVCKQDFNATKPVANLSSESVGQAWEKLRPYFLANYAGRFGEWPPCAKCDEWYTYNF